MCICDTFFSQTSHHMPGRQLQGETEEVGLDKRPKYPPPHTSRVSRVAGSEVVWQPPSRPQGLVSWEPCRFGEVANTHQT